MDCFISYSSSDSDMAHRLYNLIQALGMTAFLANVSIKPGESGEEAIWSKLRESKYFILLASQKACSSDFVQQEFGGAKFGNLKFIPVVWDMSPSKLPGWMNQTQALDLRNMGHEEAELQLNKMVQNLESVGESRKWSTRAVITVAIASVIIGCIATKYIQMIAAEMLAGEERRKQFTQFPDDTIIDFIERHNNHSDLQRVISLLNDLRATVLDSKMPFSCADRILKTGHVMVCLEASVNDMPAIIEAIIDLVKARGATLQSSWYCGVISSLELLRNCAAAEGLNIPCPEYLRELSTHEETTTGFEGPIQYAELFAKRHGLNRDK